MPWNSKQPDLKNNPAYLEPRVTAVESSLAQKVSQGELVVSVKDKAYGAKGDGVTDDTTAIQNALNSGAREVFIPVGEYVISSTLTVPDYTDLKLAGDSYSWQTTSKVAKLKLTANVDLINLGNHCSIKGGLLDARNVTNFSKACVKVDYSGSKEISNSKVESTIMGSNQSGYGIEFYAGANGSGLIFPFYVKGNIQNFAKGIYSHKDGANTQNWFSGLFVDATLANNTTAIDLSFGGNGGRISGSCQPLVTTGGSINATNAPLIRVNSSYMIIDTMIWDMTTAINNIGLENNGQSNLLVGNLSLTSKYINDLQVDPYKLIRSEDGRFNGTPNNESYVSRKNMNGHQDNLLLGAHKKFTINKTLTNAIVGGGGGGLTPDGMFMDGNQASYIALTDTTQDGNVVYEIPLDMSRAIKYVGLKFTARPYRCKIELYSDKTASYVTVVDGYSDSMFWQSGGVDSIFYWEYDYNRDYANFGAQNERKISKIRFTIYLSPSSTYSGKTFCDVSVAFAYDGSISFIPPHGGTLYGDLDLNKNKMKNMVLDQAVTASRPTTPVKGQMFYDTTLNKPIWYNGTAWTDATGTIV